jgi:hypothetical protein
MAKAHVEGWLINDPVKQATLAADLYTIGHDPEARHADRIAAIKALMAADFNAAKLDVDNKNADTARAAIFAPHMVRRMLDNPAAMALACELDAQLAADDGPDPGGVRTPGLGGEVALPGPPVAPEPETLPGGGGPVPPTAPDHAPEAR